MSEDHRSVAHPEVDELVTVGVPDLATLAPINVDRALAPGAEIRIGAAGERLERSLVKRLLGVATERGRGPGGGFRGHQDPRGGRSVDGRGDAAHGTRVARCGTAVGASCHRPVGGVNATFVVFSPACHESRAVKRGSLRIRSVEPRWLDFVAMRRRGPNDPVSYWLRDPGPPADPPLDAGEHP